MTDKYLKLAASLLIMASDEFANHGCNDLEDSFFTDWTKQELIDFTKAYEDWNSGGEQFNPNHLYLPDYAVMGFLAHLLNSEQAPETSVASKDAQGSEPRLPNSLPISQVLELIRYCAEKEFYYDGGKLRGNAPYSAPSTTEEEILTNFLNQQNTNV